MAKYKILVDSSSNLLSGFETENPDVLFDVVPLTIRIQGRDYPDDDVLDIPAMLQAYHAHKNDASTSCPSPAAFLDRMNGADYYLIFTMTSKLSGTFNSAQVARSSFDHPENVFVLDCEAVGGVLEILVREALEEIRNGVPFETLIQDLQKKEKDCHLLFVLQRFDTLVKAGRIDRVKAFLASRLHIKPIGVAKEGTIHQLEPIRPLEGTEKRLMVNIGKLCPHPEGKTCILSYTAEAAEAERLMEKIRKTYPFKAVLLRENRGLVSYYSLEKALLIAFD